MTRFADDLILFAHLVDHASYSRTARVLGVQKSFLSRRIAALEAALGMVLLERRASGPRITDLGLQVYEQARMIRDHCDAAFDVVDQHRNVPSGALNVVCPALLADMVFGAVAISFAASHPRVRLSFDVRTVLPTNGLEAYDIVIMPATGSLPDADFVARRIMNADYELVAAPVWVEQNCGNTLDAMQGCPAVGWWHDAAPEAWMLMDGAGQTQRLNVVPMLRTNDLVLAAKAAVAGLGLARLPAAQSMPYLADGQLVRVLPEYRPVPISIYAAYSSRRALTAAGRAFILALEHAVAQA